MISYGLEAINPYNGHQRRERKGESEEQERGAKMVILYGLEAINPYNGHQRGERGREGEREGESIGQGRSFAY